MDFKTAKIRYKDLKYWNIKKANEGWFLILSGQIYTDDDGFTMQYNTLDEVLKEIEAITGKQIINAGLFCNFDYQIKLDV